jgi:hypothetical protein
LCPNTPLIDPAMSDPSPNGDPPLPTAALAPRGAAPRSRRV